MKVLSWSWRVSLLCFSQAGGFYSAEDADSYPTTTSGEKREGAFCVWTAEELRALLPEPVEGATEGTTLADVFMHHYGVEEAGNVDPMKVRQRKICLVPGGICIHRHSGMAEQPQNTQQHLPSPMAFLERVSLSLQDPHQELKGKNVLIARSSLELTAARFGLEPGRLSALLQECRHRLCSARAQRPRPHLDTKMLAAWNGERWLHSGNTCLGWAQPGPAGTGELPQRHWDQGLWSWAGWKQPHTCKP